MFPKKLSGLSPGIDGANKLKILDTTCKEDFSFSYRINYHPLILASQAVKVLMAGLEPARPKLGTGF